MSKSKRETTGKRGTRPTVALITDQIVYEYQTDIATGVLEVARERDVNLLCFIGGRLGASDGFESQGNVIYDFVSAESVDGVVILTSAVGSQADPQGIRSFCEGFRPLPIVSVGVALEGITSLVVDNEAGLRDMLGHLIKHHGYRRIAFIRGPETSEEAELRYRTYINVLEEAGLPFAPDLVAPGDFVRPAGAAAIDLLLDERGVNFEAIVAANDDMALGALEALQARGVRVPQEVAVVGFDDVGETELVTPPLTTVRQSLYKQGRQATEMVLALLAGEKIPEQVTPPAEVVIRQSCGCLPPAVSQPGLGQVAKENRRAVEAAMRAQRKTILSEMMRAAGVSSVGFTAEQAEQLLDAFSDELSGKSSGVFLPTLNSILNQAIWAGGSAVTWQEGLSTLRQHLLPHLDEGSLSQAEALCLQARVLIGETAQRAQGYRTLQAEVHTRTLWEVGAALITTLDLADSLDVLAEGLPRVGIPSAYLALYEDPQPYAYPQSAPGWSRLMLAYDEANTSGSEGDSKGTTRVDLGVEGRRFPSHRLVPEDLLPQDRQYCLVVRPLFFQQNQIGFVLFEAGTRELATCEMLSTQISSTLQGARLLEDQRRAEETLVEERNLLRTLIDNLPEYVFAKDAEGRFVVGNMALARHMGAATPGDLIGKTDFDFYPQKLAAQFYADEQALFQSGQSMLDHEEATQDPSGNPRWTLTTKVLLYDSRGKVTGLVGVSRDITSLKQTDLALERRALQLQTATEVSRAASSILDPDELIRQVVDLIHERFGLYYVGLFLVDESGDWAVLRAGTGKAGRQMIAQGHKLEVKRTSMIGTCVINKQARIALDVGEAAARFDNPLLPKTRSEVALPLISRDEAIGALTFQSAQEAAFSDEDVAVLQTMADQLANAIQNTRLFDRAQVQANEMSILNELARTLSTRLTVQEVLDEVYQQASRLLDATNFYIALYDLDTHQVTFPYDTTEEEGDKFPTLSADQGITGYIIRHRTSMLIKEGVPERLAEMGISMIGEPALSWLGVPMMLGDQVLGVMGVQSFTTPRAYDEHDRDLLTALATQVATALTNARLFEQTQAALAEVEATQRRYLERAWGEYAQTQRVSGYEQAEAELVPLGDALLPEVRQAMQEQRTSILEEDDGAAVLVVPIMLRGQSLGAVGFRVKGEDRSWGADDIALAEGVVEQFALAAENIRLLDETQRRAARERLTRDITDKMRRAASISDIVQTAVDELFGALKTSRAFVRLGVTSQDDGSDKEESQVKEVASYD
jgi:PAS domain S-box-containing protein